MEINWVRKTNMCLNFVIRKNEIYCKSGLFVRTAIIDITTLTLAETVITTRVVIIAINLAEFLKLQ